MANKTIAMIQIRQILRLHSQGKSKLQIAILTGVSRNTVKRYLRKFDEGQYTYESLNNLADHELEVLFGGVEKPNVANARLQPLQELFPELSKQLKRKGVTLQKLWEQYHERYPDGYRRSQFCFHFNQYLRGTSPVMHLEHKAGDKTYIDFAGDKLFIVDPLTGEEKKVEVFAAILGCSQLTYVEAVYSQKSEDLIKASENAFHYFGGTTAAIVPDNLKSAVTKSSKYEPQINETFAAFAEHYGTAVIPARAYRPRDKALVEGIIKIIYTRIYGALQRTFTSLEELNAAIRILLEDLNNAHLKGRDYSRRQQFEEIERQQLQPLPAYRYEFKKQMMVTVMKNGHVGLSVDKHYYSVPFRFIGKKVKILYTSTQVEIFYRYERIAVHSRNQRKYQYTTMNEHLASAHRYLSDWTADKFIEQAKVIHADVATYICRVIEGKSHPEQAFKSCSGILSLARKVGNQRLTNACRRADQYGIYNYPIIVQILDKKLDVFSPESEHTSSMPDHNNIRGGDYYQ
jgi:transposase